MKALTHRLPDGDELTMLGTPVMGNTALAIWTAAIGERFTTEDEIDGRYYRDGDHAGGEG